MRATFEQALTAAEILGSHAYERDALLLELGQEQGRDEPVSYRTFYGWCETLGIPSGRVLYKAEEVLLLLTLVWARFQKRYRGLDRKTIEQLQENYASTRNYHAA